LKRPQPAVQKKPERKDVLMEWLAGPAADAPTYSDEYIAFSAMLRAADGC